MLSILIACFLLLSILFLFLNAIYPNFRRQIISLDSRLNVNWVFNLLSETSLDPISFFLFCETANQKVMEYYENEVKVKLKIMFSRKLSLLLQNVVHLSLIWIIRKTKILHKNISTYLHKTSKSAANYRSY